MIGHHDADNRRFEADAAYLRLLDHVYQAYARFELALKRGGDFPATFCDC
jgi:hypothetical protein